MRDNTLLYRVCQLENKVTEIDRKLDRILEEELPEMHAEVLSLSTRINVLSIINIGAIVLGILVSKVIT